MSADASYERARKLYFELHDNVKDKRYRHAWIRVIAAFKSVYENYPSNSSAPRALYTMAELWSDLHRLSRVQSDIDRALSCYAQVEIAYSESRLADDALWQRAMLMERRLQRPDLAAYEVKALLDAYPRGDMVSRARNWARRFSSEMRAIERSSRTERPSAKLVQGSKNPSSKKISIQDLKYWSNPTYTRVAIYLDSPVEFQEGTLPHNQRAGLPERIYVDLRGANIVSGKVVDKTIDDSLLASIRIAQHNSTTVRIVFDLQRSIDRHRILIMENPYRIVLDAFSKVEGEASKGALASRKSALGEHKPLIVIDPGHGGKDSGARGADGIPEKVVVMAVSKRISQELERQGFEVRLTRDSDTFVSLEERTAMANRWSADLFLSIHANSHQDASIRGAETYYLDVTNDKYALRLAALENKTSEDQVSAIKLLLADISTKLHTRESSHLARRIQANIVRLNQRQKGKSKDLGVKASLFYVLLGARMPAVLVELGFISNRKEALLLNSLRYQKKAARAISQAVVSHHKQDQGT